MPDCTGPVNIVDSRLQTSDVAAAAADPGAPWAAACAAQQAGRFLAAAEAYLACAPDPLRGRAPALFSAAWCHELARQPDAAIALYRQALEHAREPALRVESLFRLGWIAIEAGDMRDAGPHLAELLELAATHALAGATIDHARYWHAVCLEHDGQLIEAAQRYAPIVAQGDPDLWLEAAYRRLQCLSQVGDLRGAAAAAATLLGQAHPVRDPARLQALSVLASDEATQIARALEAA
jgi:tetratricopeptide (TPR) repeat protein